MGSKTPGQVNDVGVVELVAGRQPAAGDQMRIDARGRDEIDDGEEEDLQR